jgi:hypothetical protein
MSFLFKRSKKAIYHIDSLDKNMKIAIKTIIDCSMSDVAKAYGLRYAIPKWGEPIFVPYGELDGEFNSTREAYSRIEEEINESSKEGISQFKSWYPNSQILNQYRISYYSFTDEHYGYIAGIGADPLITHRYFQLPELKGKNVFILSPALSAVTDFPFLDNIYQYKKEIIESYSWANSQFHSKYDKDNSYDEELGMYFMGILMDKIRKRVEKNARNQIENADVLVVPLFVGQNKYGHGESIKERWIDSEFYRKSMYHELEALPAIWNTESAGNLIMNSIGKFSTLVLLFDKGVPSMEKCKEECLSQYIGPMRVVEDKERYKIIELVK